MDPLSDVLSLLKPQSYYAGGFAVNEDVAIRFPKHEGIKCYAVASGRGWLVVDGVADPVRMEAGDCFLLPRGRPFCLTTDLSLKPVNFEVFRAQWQHGVGISSGDSRLYHIVGGHFALRGHHADLLLRLLPPVVHIGKDSDRAAMRWALQRMIEELREPQPGGSLMVQQLAYLMLVQALRLHLADVESRGVGWLFALADKQMSAVIEAMHNEPAYPWTLDKLADRAGMSRSSFALRFKEKVGKAPMEYLTRWRMLLAGDRLQNSDESIAAIAASLGYESESGFGKVFKKVTGYSPRQFGRSVGNKEESIPENPQAEAKEPQRAGSHSASPGFAEEPAL